MNATDYLILLNLDARCRVKFEVDKRKVIRFTVQLELFKENQRLTVVRYDTAHGTAHRDTYKADGSVSRHEALAVSEYNDALTYAIRDIRLNWDEWVRQYQES